MLNLIAEGRRQRIAPVLAGLVVLTVASVAQEPAARIEPPSARPEWWAAVKIPIPLDKPVALPEDLNWDDSLTAYGMRFEAQGKAREAAKVLTYALPKCETELQRAFVLFQTALIYEVGLKDYVRAYALFDDLLRLPIGDGAKRNETQAYARFGQARCLEQLGPEPRAREAYEGLLQDCPGLNVEVNFRLGRLAQARKDRSAAERHFTECIRAASPPPGTQGGIYASRFVLMSRLALKELSSGPVDLATVRDGTYVGKAYGYNSVVSVSVKMQTGRIAGVTVLSQDDKRPFDAFTTVPDRIRTRQSLDVDAVTGATVTSEAIANAVKQALHGAPRAP